MINRYLLLFNVVFTILLFKESHAQNKQVIEKIIEIGKADNQTMDHLDILTNRFGGRPIGSDAYENAADWAAHKFRQWGMDVLMDEDHTL